MLMYFNSEQGRELLILKCWSDDFSGSPPKK